MSRGRALRHENMVALIPDPLRGRDLRGAMLMETGKRVVENAAVDGHVQQLGGQGFAWLRGSIEDCKEAFELARAVVGARSASDRAAALAVVGEFVLPPPDAQESRDFQTLHFDFGIPLDPKVKGDVGRYTALYIPKGFGPVSAVTRLVPLAALLRQRSWPSETDLLARLAAYGQTHGARNDDRGYVEGSLARVVEAAAGVAALPSVKAEANFRCGTEFAGYESEVRFFERHSLRVEAVQIKVPLSPGELLVFDNLAVAHGRLGTRRPGELRQWVFGESNVGMTRQRELRDHVLAGFRAPDKEPAHAKAGLASDGKPIAADLRR
jgi:Taurine catabolism dioxygenase TauD, TfdA family